MNKDSYIVCAVKDFNNELLIISEEMYSLSEASKFKDFISKDARYNKKKLFILKIC